MLPDKHFPILVTGAAGLLGRALGPRLVMLARQPDLVHQTDAVHIDVTDPRAVETAVRAIQPRTIFHLAAYTDVDGAESHAADALRLNADAAENVARAAAAAGAVMVQLSTDFVFCGDFPGVLTEDAPIAPRGVYAETKAEGEARVRAAAPDHHLIVRTAWLYGAGKGFIDAILGAARAGKPLSVITDQVGCPTWSEDLARALVALVAADARGTFHACGAGEASRWEMAVEALCAAGLDVPVARSLTAQYPRPAPRPTRAVLSTEKLERVAGFKFPAWQESVRAYVKSISDL